MAQNLRTADLWHVDRIGSNCILCCLEKRGKGKSHPRTGHEGPEGEQIYSSNLSLTSAGDGVDGQRHVPAALPLERPCTKRVNLT